MQHISETLYKPKRSSCRSHKSTKSFDPKKRTQQNRYEFLLLAKRVGKAAGFTPRMLMLLDYYMSFTKEIDWEEGARPIVYQSLAKTALDLAISERQVQRLEKSLSEVGAITWHDSGNHKRFGQRCKKTGKLIYAYGVDLSPLRDLEEHLKHQLQQKKEADEYWLETKRKISALRGHIRALLKDPTGVGGVIIENFQSKYDAIAKPIRTYMSQASLSSLLEEHRKLYDLLKRLGLRGRSQADEQEKESCSDDKNVAHIESSTQEQSNKLESPARRGAKEFKQKPHKVHSSSFAPTDWRSLTLSQAIDIASDRFKELLPLRIETITWHDIVDVAYQIRRDLKIGNNQWVQACQNIGRVGAALCVLLTDQATQRRHSPVHKPAGYFRKITLQGNQYDPVNP